MAVTSEGTLSFRCSHSDKDWATNAKGYRFEGISVDELKASALKHPNRTVSVYFSGPHGKDFSFHHPMPLCDLRGFLVVITWTTNAVKLYLNGGLVESVEIESEGTDGNR
jgi:hypothetical protein